MADPSPSTSYLAPTPSAATPNPLVHFDPDPPTTPRHASLKVPSARGTPSPSSSRHQHRRSGSIRSSPTLVEKDAARSKRTSAGRRERSDGSGSQGHGEDGWGGLGLLAELDPSGIRKDSHDSFPPVDPRVSNMDIELALANLQSSIPSSAAASSPTRTRAPSPAAGRARSNTATRPASPTIELAERKKGVLGRMLSLSRGKDKGKEKERVEEARPSRNRVTSLGREREEEESVVGDEEAEEIFEAKVHSTIPHLTTSAITRASAVSHSLQKKYTLLLPSSGTPPNLLAVARWKQAALAHERRRRHRRQRGPPPASSSSPTSRDFDSSTDGGRTSSETTGGLLAPPRAATPRREVTPLPRQYTSISSLSRRNAHVWEVFAEDLDAYVACSGHISDSSEDEGELTAGRSSTLPRPIENGHQLQKSRSGRSHARMPFSIHSLSPQSSSSRFSGAEPGMHSSSPNTSPQQPPRASGTYSRSTSSPDKYHGLSLRSLVRSASTSLESLPFPAGGGAPSPGPSPLPTPGGLGSQPPGEFMSATRRSGFSNKLRLTASRRKDGANVAAAAAALDSPYDSQTESDAPTSRRGSVSGTRRSEDRGGLRRGKTIAAWGNGIFGSGGGRPKDSLEVGPSPESAQDFLTPSPLLSNRQRIFATSDIDLVDEKTLDGRLEAEAAEEERVQEEYDSKALLLQRLLGSLEHFATASSTATSSLRAAAIHFSQLEHETRSAAAFEVRYRPSDPRAGDELAALRRSPSAIEADWEAEDLLPPLASELPPSRKSSFRRSSSSRFEPPSPQPAQPPPQGRPRAPRRRSSLDARGKRVYPPEALADTEDALEKQIVAVKTRAERVAARQERMQKRLEEKLALPLERQAQEFVEDLGMLGRVEDQYDRLMSGAAQSMTAIIFWRFVGLIEGSLVVLFVFLDIVATFANIIRRALYVPLFPIIVLVRLLIWLFRPLLVPLWTHAIVPIAEAALRPLLLLLGRLLRTIFVAGRNGVRIARGWLWGDRD